MRIWPALAALAFSAIALSPALAVTPLKITSISALASLPALSWPYYELGISGQSADSVLARAKQQHKLALIVLRADWCHECHTLAAFLALPEVRRFVDAHYIVARVDVGHRDKNLHIPARWGIVDRLSGLPTIIIVDPSDNSLVNRGAIAELAKIDRMTPQQIADWLTWWAK
jgi:hypothetical protein